MTKTQTTPDPLTSDEQLAGIIGYCEHCGWPVAADGVTIHEDMDTPREGGREHRCDDAACTVVSDAS